MQKQILCYIKNNDAFRGFRLSIKIAMLLIALIILSSCKSAMAPAFSSQQHPASPDYENVTTWAILPYSYPENLKHWQTNNNILEADIFYIYPTLNIEKKD